MKKHILYILLLSLSALFSCEKKICSAYSSYFMYIEEDRVAYFSPFEGDSIPKTEKDDKVKKNHGLFGKHNYKKHKEKIDLVDIKVANKLNEKLLANVDSSKLASNDAADIKSDIINVSEEEIDGRKNKTYAPNGEEIIDPLSDEEENKKINEAEDAELFKENNPNDIKSSSPSGK